MKHQKRIVLTVILIVLSVIVVIVGSLLLSKPRGGSFEIDDSIVSAILRYHMSTIPGSEIPESDKELRASLNGRLTGLICIKSGNFVEGFAKNLSIEQMLRDANNYYYAMFDRVKMVNSYDSRITWTTAEHYVAINPEGSAYKNQIYPEWARFYEFAADPHKVLPLFTQVKAVWCLDDFQGANGSYIYYETSDGGYILYRVVDAAYLVPYDAFRTACVDAIAAFDAKNEENGYVSGAPDVAPYLQDYLRADLDVAEAKKNETEVPDEVEGANRDWVAICLAEISVGALLFVLVLWFKRYESRRYAKRRSAEEETGESAEQSVDEKNTDEKSDDDQASDVQA